MAGNYHVTRQAFPPSGLPDFARDKIEAQVELRDGVGNIEALLQMEEIKLSPPMASDLVRYMNAQNQQPHQHIESLYWQVSPAAIRGVLDQIRNLPDAAGRGTPSGHVVGRRRAFRRSG